MWYVPSYSDGFIIHIKISLITPSVANIQHPVSHIFISCYDIVRDEMRRCLNIYWQLLVILDNFV